MKIKSVDFSPRAVFAWPPVLHELQDKSFTDLVKDMARAGWSVKKMGSKKALFAHGYGSEKYIRYIRVIG